MVNPSVKDAAGTYRIHTKYGRSHHVMVCPMTRQCRLITGILEVVAVNVRVLHVGFGCSHSRSRCRPTFECVCGYSCGSAKAWARHEARAGGTHTLLDPSLLTAQEPPAPEGDASSLLVRRPAREQRTYALHARDVSRSLAHESMPLIQAARHGDVSRLRSLLAAQPSPADLSRCDAAGMSAMGWAAQVRGCPPLSLRASCS